MKVFCARRAIFSRTAASIRAMSCGFSLKNLLYKVFALKALSVTLGADLQVAVESTTQVLWGTKAAAAGDDSDWQLGLL